MTDQINYIKHLERKIEKLKGHNLCLELDKDELLRREEHLMDDVERFSHYLHEAEVQQQKTKEALEACQENIFEMTNIRDNMLEKIQTLRDQKAQLMHQHTQYCEDTDVQIQELQNTVEVPSDQNYVMHNQIEHLQMVIAMNGDEEPEEDPEENLEQEAEEDPMELGLGEVID